MGPPVNPQPAPRTDATRRRGRHESGQPRCRVGAPRRSRVVRPSRKRTRDLQCPEEQGYSCTLYFNMTDAASSRRSTRRRLRRRPQTCEESHAHAVSDPNAERLARRIIRAHPHHRRHLRTPRAHTSTHRVVSATAARRADDGRIPIRKPSRPYRSLQLRLTTHR